MVGDPSAPTEAGIAAGTVYVFVRNGTVWTEQQQLTPSDARVGQLFGRRVAIDGETILVGMSTSPATSTSVYVFKRHGTAWAEQQILTAGDNALWNEFGESIAISGDTAVIGSPRADHEAGDAAGAVFVFRRAGETWTLQQKLIASNPVPFGAFGSAVDISGETIVVGRPTVEGPTGAGNGSVVVYVRTGTTWTEQQSLFASDTQPLDHLGWSVAIDGETIIAGAPAAFYLGTNLPGAAYVFVRTGTIWSEVKKLLPVDGSASDQFGLPVDISGSTIIIGAPSHDIGDITNAGAVYVFSIYCRPNMAVVAPSSCPLASGAIVNNSSPSGSCSDATVTCSPPSGSFFPLGTTTVTCTQTDSEGNQTHCTFTVTVYNGYLQDDAKPGNTVLFDSQTGEYRFTCNGKVVASGRGTLSRKGCVVTLQHNTSGRRVTINADFSARRGSATLQMPAGTVLCSITDRNTSNNSPVTP